MNAPRSGRLALLIALTACSAPADEVASTVFSPVADVQELMLTVVEPAAEVYWDAVGTIIDLEGTTEIRPQGVEEWEAVRNAAYVIAESGNLLMMQGRAEDHPAWIPMSRALVDVGRQAIEAANAMDESAVFDIGAEIYYVCSNCHASFAVETLRPNDERAN